MSDLIHKGKLFNALANVHDKGEIFSIIQDMQTVDAVEVVRCGEILKGELMTDREKLIELLLRWWSNSVIILADYLLSNGVVVRDKGEWIDVWSGDGNEYIGDGCDHCGFITTQKTKNFCPNCGADMRGEHGN